MEGSVKRDDVRAFGRPVIVVEFARHFYGQFARFSAGIGKECGVGKSMFGQQIGQLLLGFDMIEVGHMPQRVRLLGQRIHQRGVCVAQHVHRNARAKVEKTSAVRLNQPSPFAADEIQRGTIVGGQNGRDHRMNLCKEGALVRQHRPRVNNVGKVDGF